MGKVCCKKKPEEAEEVVYEVTDLYTSPEARKL